MKALVSGYVGRIEKENKPNFICMNSEVLFVNLFKRCRATGISFMICRNLVLMKNTYFIQNLGWGRQICMARTEAGKGFKVKCILHSGPTMLFNKGEIYGQDDN